MDVRVSIPQFAYNMNVKWTDREMVFMAFMAEIGYNSGWDTAYYMHIHDYSKILGCHPLKFEQTFKRLKKVFNFAKLNHYTVRIQGISAGKVWGGTPTITEPLPITDPKAIAIWYYLCGTMLHGVEKILSDSDGRIPYTHNMQGKNNNHYRLISIQSSMLDNVS